MFRLSHTIFLLCFCVRAFASEPDLSPDFLAREASLVVRGVVNSKTVKRDAGKRIVTEVKIGISETWKGKAPGKSLTLVHPGGILGEEIMVTSAQANYQIDEEVILFLVPGDSRRFVTVGAGNGKFHVNQDAREMAGSLSGAAISVAELKSIVSKKP